jgi:large subunit ribosomal protein L20
MPRAKRGFKARRRRNRALKHAKGYHLARSRIYTDAVEQVRHGWRDAWRHRRQKKRNFRKLWIIRIGAAAREHGVSYSKLMHRLKTANIGLDRKVLADLALHDPGAFKAVVDAAG